MHAPSWQAGQIFRATVPSRTTCSGHSGGAQARYFSWEMLYGITAGGDCVSVSAATRNRTATVNYASTWWNRRSPAYYDFSNLGGDCTNYVSQCLYAGGAPNDTSGSYVRYYYTSSNRSASWTGVDPLFNYIVNNYSPIGPYGYNTDFYSVSAGDVVQFRWAASGGFQHTMLINRVYQMSGYNAALYLAGHSNNTYDYPLSYIAYNSIRYIRIGGYLK